MINDNRNTEIFETEGARRATGVSNIFTQKKDAPDSEERSQQNAPGIQKISNRKLLPG